MSHSASLLVELFTEELPPKSLKRLGEAFSEHLLNKLVSLGLVGTNPKSQSFASPRRLAVLIQEVCSKAPDLKVKEKLLPVSIALTDQGLPSAPLIKKLANLGITNVVLSDLERIGEGKNESFYIEINKIGLDLVKGLAIHGSDVVPISVLGLQAGRSTLGHRFLSNGIIEFGHADEYESKLLQEGKVIANFQKRLETIQQQLLSNANQFSVLMPNSLLEEVNSLVEWPTVYSCEFEKEFLDVPQECLILTMQTNQKYFALTDKLGKLTNRFLIVSNIETSTPESIIAGNERVVRPRLSDAKFFYQQDQKTPLINRFEDLSKVVYHNKLGNQKERINRIIKIYLRIMVIHRIPPNNTLNLLRAVGC